MKYFVTVLTTRSSTPFVATFPSSPVTDAPSLPPRVDFTAEAETQSIASRTSSNTFRKYMDFLMRAMVTKYSRIALTVLTVFGLTSTTMSQSVAIRIPITVQDALGHSSTTYIGVHPLATYCRDADTLKDFCDGGSVFERLAPPVPPNDTLFDVRLTDTYGEFNSDCMDQGLLNSIQQFVSITQIDTFRVAFQNSIGYPFTFSWPAYLSYYCDSMKMKDAYGFDIVNVNMLTQSSVQVTDNSIAAVFIIMYGLKQHVCPPGISGTVFNDYNDNGMRDVGEPGLTGWTVNLSGPVTESVLTDADGFYSFNNLSTGSYTVTEDIQSEWTQTMPLAGSYTVSYSLASFTAGNDFGNFHGGSISGSVGSGTFKRKNKQSVKSVREMGLQGWTVNLVGPMNNQTTTDVNGNYSFSHLLPGTYTLSEVQQNNWQQTVPSGDGKYTITINTMEDHTGIDFKNTAAVPFTGDPGGNFSNPANWPGAVVPGPTDFVSLSVPVVLDAVPPDGVQGVRLQDGGTLTVQPNLPPLEVQTVIQIDENATLQFPPDDPTSGMICHGDWLNHGTFSAGQSTISFVGDEPKVIDVTAFYNLTIGGLNTGSGDNIGVTNTLTLQQSLAVRMQDTIFVENSSPDAIADTGRILGGTIKRQISQGETGAYRFESPQSFLQFNGAGEYPTSVAITTITGSDSRAFNLPWQVMGKTVNQFEHTVSADSVKSFSKWSVGIPKPLNVDASLGVPSVERFYLIDNTGGSGFMAHVQLRYDTSEINPSTTESALRLLRGPVIVDSVLKRWNMISLPLITDDTLKNILFPTASSPAFAFESSYQEKSSLRFGPGYWLKFPGAQHIQIIGNDVEEESLAVTKGWNMIGALSFPISAASVTSIPEGSITSQFYGFADGYYVADSLRPLRAYWVKVSTAGQLILSTTASSMKIRSSSSKVENFSSLIFHDANGGAQKLYIGSKTNIDMRQFEMPPVPPAGIFDVRYSSQRIMELSTSKEERNIPILISSAEYPVTVNWEIKSLKANASLIVDGKEIPMRTNASAKITNPTSQITLRLSGSPALPTEFRLEQNYPNPFNPSTTIRYQLPVASRVVLKIYNLLGQEVKTLVDGVVDEGYKSVEWNSVNNSGASIATGVYFYRIEATAANDPSKTFIQVRKLILLK